MSLTVPPYSAHLIRLESVDSTNNYLMHLPDAAWQEATFCVVTARYQQAGRGQQGNSWESAPGENLLFSLGVHPRFLRPVQQFALSRAIALAVRDTAAAEVPDVTIKWPNDIYVGDRKLCGILIECDLQAGRLERACLGVGLNLNQTNFCSGAPNPVSLRTLTGRTYRPDAVLQRLLAGFARYYHRLETEGSEALNADYERHLYRRTGLHAYCDGNGAFRARLGGVESDGHLLLCDEADTVRRYAFKEVRFVLPGVEHPC